MSELNKDDMSMIDKEIELNKQKLELNKEPTVDAEKLEADIRAKVLAEMKIKEEANKVQAQNEAMLNQIKELKEAQEKQKEAFEEKISKFSGNNQTGNSYPSSNQSVKEKINKMTPEESKEWENAQKEAAFDLFERRRNGRSK